MNVRFCPACERRIPIAPGAFLFGTAFVAHLRGDVLLRKDDAICAMRFRPIDGRDEERRVENLDQLLAEVETW